MTDARLLTKLANYAVLSLALAILGALLVGVVLFARSQAADYRSIQETVGVRQDIYQLFSAIQDAETGQRGYLLTADPVYLAPYTASLGAIQAHMTALAEAFVGDDGNEAELSALQTYLDQKLAVLRATVDLAAAGKASEAIAIVKSGSGRTIMDNIRLSVGTLIRVQNDRLEAQAEHAQSANGWLSFAVLAAVLSAASLGLLAVRQYRNELRAVISGKRLLEEVNAQLSIQNEREQDLNQQLRQSQKMEVIGQLTGGLAHDFNNMLAVIMSSVNLAKRRLSRGDTDIVRYLDGAIDGAERAATLTHRLLAFSRQQPLSPETVDPNKMVAGMGELLHRTLSANVKLETVLAGGLWRVRADVSQLENSILNLAVNARDAMPDGGNLTIETSNAYLDDDYAKAHLDVAPGQYVLIAVTDTGVGMAPEVAKKAFEPFFTTKSIGKGTGLGLSQVFGFVKQSGGHISIYSEPGHGTTMKIYLPRLASDDADLTPSAALPKAIGNAPTGETILVAEDDEQVCRVTVASLRELGYAVIHAGGAAEALRLLDANPTVGLLFTDIVMPDVSGIQLAEEAVRRRPDLEVLYTTGYMPNALVHNAMLSRQEHLITKPFSIDQLAGAVREALDHPKA